MSVCMMHHMLHCGLVVLVVLVVSSGSIVYDAYNCDRNYIAGLEVNVLTSPNFPFNYTGLDQCHYKIYIPDVYLGTPTSFQICFTFRRFRLKVEPVTSQWSLPDDLLVFPGNHRYYSTGHSRPPGLKHIMEPQLCSDTSGPTFDVTFTSGREGTDIGFYAEVYMKPVNDTYNNTAEDTHTTAPCSDDEWTCFSRQCLPKSQVCDGVADCVDGTDEDYLTARCPGVRTIEACDFEGSAVDNLCGCYAYNWVLRNTSEHGPRSDHTLLYRIAGQHHGVTSGHFLQTDFGPQLATAACDMPTLSTPHPRCLTFWCFMAGAEAQLTVHFVNATGHRIRVWSRHGYEGHSWLQAHILIAGNVTVSKVDFEAVRGLAGRTDVAIDDIAILPGQCQGGNVSCTFELEGLCGWYNDPDVAQYVSWVRHHAVRRRWKPTIPRAQDMNCWYLQMQRSSHSSYNHARLLSPTVSNHRASKHCLQFWYLMHGVGASWLYVRVRDYNGEEQRLWHTYGDQGRAWLYMQLTIHSKTPFQIIIEGYQGFNWQTFDLGIDDIFLVTGSCQSSNVDIIVGPNESIVVCSADQFQCDAGDCVPTSRWCDGRFDCADFTDESNCSEIQLKEGRVKAGVIVGVICGVLFVTLVGVANIIAYHRHKRRRRSAHAPTPQPFHQMTLWRNALTHGDPPPLYDDSAGSDLQMTSAPAVIPLQSWDPPPSYQPSDVAAGAFVDSSVDLPSYEMSTANDVSPTNHQQDNDSHVIGAASHVSMPRDSANDADNDSVELQPLMTHDGQHALTGQETTSMAHNPTVPS